jgi:hypothetical protein
MRYEPESLMQFTRLFILLLQIWTLINIAL